MGCNKHLNYCVKTSIKPNLPVHMCSVTKAAEGFANGYAGNTTHNLA